MNQLIKWDGALCPLCNSSDSTKKLRYPKEFDDYYCSSCGARFAGQYTPPNVGENVFLHAYEKLELSFKKRGNK